MADADAGNAGSALQCSQNAVIPAEISEAKAGLRREVRGRLKALTPESRAAASWQACTRLRQQPVWQRARSVLMYGPIRGELDVWPLVLEALAHGMAVALPRFEAATLRYVGCWIENPERDLRCGQFGIREPNEDCAPTPLNRLDLILVPGLAYDLHGRRLGRGKGYYDQMLTEPHGVTCGVAFDEQIVSQVPVAPYDISVNCILTPTRWVEV